MIIAGKVLSNPALNKGHGMGHHPFGDDAGVAQGRRSIGAGHRLEAYATLLMSPANPVNQKV
jgi:hypothetical protein